MTGEICFVHPRGTFCFIKVLGEQENRFAHVRDFFEPEKMKEGQKVQFTPNNVPQPGRTCLGAINVESIAA